MRPGNLRLISLFFLCFPLAACLGTDKAFETGPLSLLAKGPIAGDLGQGLDAPSRKKALNAELAALASGPTGLPVKWTGTKGTSGEVTPGQPFEVAGKTCRRYAHVVVLEGAQRSAQSTACVNDEGIWEPVG